MKARTLVKGAGLTGAAAAGGAALGVSTVLAALVREALTAPDPIDDGPDPLLAAPTQQPERIDVRGTDGARLSVLAYGPADGDLVVFAHGWTCNTHHWYPQINHLADTCRVVVYDQRGHGDSEMGHVKASPELLGRDLQQVLRAVVPEGRRAVIAGHSMGGMTILSWAQLYPQNVDRYARAVVLNSTAATELMERLAVVPEGLPGYARPFRRLVGRLVASTPAPLPHTKYTPKVTQYIALNTTARRAHVDFCDEMITACPATVRARWGAALSAINLADGVKALTVPTAVIVGTDDRLTPRFHADSIAEILTDTDHLFEYLVMPNIGHMSNIEDGERYNELLDKIMAATADRREIHAS